MTEENSYFEEIAPPEEKVEETTPAKEEFEKVETSIDFQVKDDFQIEEDPVPEQIAEKIAKDKDSLVVVNAEFKKPTTEIRVISLITGKTEQALATNRSIKLLKDKQYFIPVNTNENSDNYPTIKVLSIIANSVEVKYVQDGFACIQVLINKTVIIDSQRLCILC